MHVKTYLREKRIARLNREIVLLQSMDTHLWWKAWFYIVIKSLLSACILGTMLYFNFDSDFSLTWRLILATCIIIISVIAWRYPFQLFLLLTFLLFSIILATLLEAGDPVVDWPDLGRSNTAKAKKSYLGRANKVALAIDKRRKLIEALTSS